MEQIRILFLAACPADLPRAKVEAEIRFIESELDQAQEGRFDCRFVPSAGRAHLLRQLLKLQPHVVHFSGHGSEQDELILETESGGSEPISAGELEEIFQVVPAANRPSVVVLSACYSIAQAKAVTRVVDSAIGMTQEIRDSAAYAFSQGFYLALGRGLPVDEAVNAGRLAMPGDPSVRTLPRLHVKDGADLARTALGGQGPVSRFPDDLHIDRAEQLDRLQRMLNEGEPRVFAITAASGMGKSRLIEAMARDAKDHPVGKTDLTRSAMTPETALRRLGVGMGLGGPTEAPTVPNMDLGGSVGQVGTDPHLAAGRQAELARLTANLIQEAETLARKKGRRGIFLLDGFDASTGDVASWVEDIFLPAVLQSENVLCVVAGREEPTLEVALHLVARAKLDNFGETDMREVLQSLRLDSSASVVRTAWVLTENGNPFLTVSQLERLWRDAVSSVSG